MNKSLTLSNGNYDRFCFYLSNLISNRKFAEVIEFCRSVIKSNEQILKEDNKNYIVEENLDKFYLILSGILVDSKNIVESKRFIEKIKYIRDDKYYILRGKILFLEDNFTEAEKHFKEAIKLNGINADAHLYLSLCLYMLGRIEESETSINTSLKLCMNDPQSLYHKAIIENKKGNFNKAIEYCDECLKIDHLYRDAYNIKAMSLRSLNDLDRSEKCYKDGIRLFPKYIKFHNNLGNLFIQKEKYDDALQCYKQALDIDNKSLYALYSIGNICAILDNDDEAINIFSKIISQNDIPITMLNNQMIFDSFCKIGGLFSNKCDYKKAIDNFIKALKICPDNKNLQYELGNTYLKIEEHENGLYWIKQSAKRGNKHAQYKLGICYLYGYVVTPDIKKAENLLEKAKKQGHELASEELYSLKIYKALNDNETKKNLNSLYERIDSQLIIEHQLKSSSKEEYDNVKIAADNHLNNDRKNHLKNNNHIKKRELYYEQYKKQKIKKEFSKVEALSANNSLKIGFYNIYYINDIKSNLQVKVDWYSSDIKKLDEVIINQFKKVSEEHKIVIGKGKQGHKIIENILELKILGKYGDIRLWGEIIRDPENKQKTCTLSHVSRHKR